MATLNDLKKYELVYLATPYTLYYQGLDEAYREACKITESLIVRGVRAFCPIAHGHSLEGLSPGATSMWYWYNEGIMRKSDALVVGCMYGWADSKGVLHEMAEFLRMKKPRYLFNPSTHMLTELFVENGTWNDILSRNIASVGS